MSNRQYLDGLCFITDKSIRSKSIIDIAIEVIQCGITWIQLRDKSRSRRQLFKTARVLRSITSANDVKLIINDHADIALSVNADGVHLGQNDLPMTEARKIMGDKIIGISTHSLQEALEAQRDGADYIGFGPIFRTETKDAGKPVGIHAIKDLKRLIRTPLVAIGGITEENLIDVFHSGANAVAVSSGITKQDDISVAANRYVQLIERVFEN